MAAIAPNYCSEIEYPAAGRNFADEDPNFGDNTEEPAIDLVHLARQTMSDEALEVELLELFERQSARIISQLTEAGAGASRFRGDLAHTLRGSALAIGAGRVARSAQAFETVCAAGAREGSADAALAALVEAVAEARAAIARLLA